MTQSCDAEFVVSSRRIQCNPLTAGKEAVAGSGGRAYRYCSLQGFPHPAPSFWMGQSGLRTGDGWSETAPSHGASTKPSATAKGKRTIPSPGHCDRPSVRSSTLLHSPCLPSHTSTQYASKYPSSLPWVPNKPVPPTLGLEKAESAGSPSPDLRRCPNGGQPYIDAPFAAPRVCSALTNNRMLP